MDPENYTKGNRNILTNILLFLVLLVLVGILFFLIKNNQKEELNPIYDLNEEVPVYIEPINNPVEITREPISNPTPVISPIANPNPIPVSNPQQLQNISLVAGQEYTYEFSSDSSVPKAKYCGIVQSSGKSFETEEYYSLFVPLNSENCSIDQFGAAGYHLNNFSVKLKSGVSENNLTSLNSTYGVIIENQDITGAYTLKINNQNLNSYTLAKLYYDSGFFVYTQPYLIFSINSN